MRRTILLSIAAGLLALAGCVSAAARMERGDILATNGAYGAALREYRAAQAKDPTLPGIDEKIRITAVRLNLSLADEAIERGQWDVAERCYREVRRLDPYNPEIERGLERLRRGRAESHYQRGQALLARGNPFDAIAEFERALTLDPDHSRARDALARTRGAAQSRRDGADAEFAAGERARDAKRYEAALRHFERALELDPHHSGARAAIAGARNEFAEELVREGDALAERGNWAQCLEVYRKALELEPALPGLGERVARADREARAASLVREANLAFERGEWRSAYDHYGQALELTADASPFMERYEQSRERLAAEIYSEAQSLESDGRFADALEVYRSIKRLIPEYRDVRSKCEHLEFRLRSAGRAYVSGCRAQDERDMQRAHDEFIACVEAIPSYRDAESRLREVRDALAQARGLYEGGLRAEARGDIERARILFEECLAVSFPFLDAEARLARLQQTTVIDIDVIYEDACRAYDRRDLIRARKLFRSCRRTRPGYRDVDTRLISIDTTLGELSRRYPDLVKADREGRFRLALKIALEIQGRCVGFEDVDDRLPRLRAEVAYADARELELGGRYGEALERFIVCSKQVPGFRDVDERIRVCRVRSGPVGDGDVDDRPDHPDHPDHPDRPGDRDHPVHPVHPGDRDHPVHRDHPGRRGHPGHRDHRDDGGDDDDRDAVSD